MVNARADLIELARTSASDSLPAEHVELTARRLGVVAAIAAAIQLLYLVLYRTLWAADSNPVGMASGVVVCVCSIAIAAYVLPRPRPRPWVAGSAIAYELVLTLMLGFSESWAVGYQSTTAQVSWTAIVIVLFPYLIPARPGTVLLAALASATSVPLTIALRCVSADLPSPSGAVLASYVLPPFLCALLAWAPTSALHRLGVAVQHARRLGNYELSERLGAGGMGEVWRANHRLIARPAAVKLIRPEMLGVRDGSARDALIRRFEKEAQAIASLDCVHTVELYDFGVSPDGALFYVMELLDGVDVQQLVERFGPLPAERCVHLLLQACDSLHDAHCRGLVHRDIKPANLFVARKGGTYDFLKVLDFGLVKRWRSEGIEPRLDTQAGAGLATSLQTNLEQILGTPAFLAPEAALGEQALDGRADVYALGCVAYWMLTGRLVFEESSALAMAVAHVTKDPVPVSERTSQPLLPELEQLVMQCLHKDRERRPPTAAALRDALNELPLAAAWTRAHANSWWREHLPHAARSGK